MLLQEPERMSIFEFKLKGFQLAYSYQVVFKSPYIFFNL